MIQLRAATADDAAAIVGIYTPFVEETVITFEATAPSADDMVQRMRAGDGLYPWIVACDGDRVVGYAYATVFKPRAAYLRTVEASIYVAPAMQRHGTGETLYRKLIETLIAQGFVQALATIGLPNEASVRLHEKLGFVQSGMLPQVGFKLGRWHDIGLWLRPLSPAEVPPGPLVPFADVSAALGLVGG